MPGMILHGPSLTYFDTWRKTNFSKAQTFIDKREITMIRADKIKEKENVLEGRKMKYRVTKQTDQS